MVINRTNAVETRIQEVSPVSSVGVGAGAAGVSATGASAVVVAVAGDVDAAATSDVGVVTASSAQTAVPPKRAPDRLSAISIFFIRVPQPHLRVIFYSASFVPI